MIDFKKEPVKAIKRILAILKNYEDDRAEEKLCHVVKFVKNNFIKK